MVDRNFLYSLMLLFTVSANFDSTLLYKHSLNSNNCSRSSSVRSFNASYNQSAFNFPSLLSFLCLFFLLNAIGAANASFKLLTQAFNDANLFFLLISDCKSLFVFCNFFFLLLNLSHFVLGCRVPKYYTKKQLFVVVQL